MADVFSKRHLLREMHTQNVQEMNALSVPRIRGGWVILD